MAGVEKKSLDSPDDTRSPEKTTVAVANVANSTVGRSTLQPGHDAWVNGDQPFVGVEFDQTAATTFAK